MSEYKEIQESKYKKKTLELLETLPSFCRTFYDGRQMRLSANTQYNYANKMKVFLYFLHENIPKYMDKNIKDYTLTDFANVTPEIARNFVTYMNNKPVNAKSIRSNQQTTADNYVACISSYYTYFIKNRTHLEDGTEFVFNPFSTIDRVKHKHKEIIYMDKETQAQFLATVESGNGLTDRQLIYHDKVELRERCICELLLDTGMRVSELVGIDLDDINFTKCSIFIKRKGNKEDTVYFSDDTKDIVEMYIQSRSQYKPSENEKALFLSSTGNNQGKRLSVRSVERIIKKYAFASAIPKCHQITPHKLRSSFAMESYETSGDLGLVQNQLGHENINTTTIYAQSLDKDKEKNRNNRSKHKGENR